MSSILKALKKVEDDKVTYRPDELRIDSEILRGNNTPRFSTISIIATSLIFLAGGSTATYMYMQHDRGTSAIVVKPSPAVTNHTTTTSTKSNEKNELSHTIVLTNKSNSVTSKITSVPSTNRVVKSKSPTTDSNQATITNHAEILSQHTQQSKETPILRVNGIAFQNGITDSMAIINGTAVSVGSVIDGATIEEIKRDKVLFRHNGERLEVQLGQSNR